MRKFVILIAVLTTACGPFHLGTRQRATVIFTNETTDQADIYATIADVQSVRLGTVLALRTDTLLVPENVTQQATGQTNIVARLLGHSFQPSTGRMSLSASDVIRVRLSSDGRNLFVTPP
jgi:hypothetical protein